MAKWVHVVTNPLGIAGFALFLLFTILSKKNAKSRFFPVFVILAIIAILGGFGLAYINTLKPQLAPPLINGQNKIIQNTSGPDSPAFAGVHGNIVINKNGGAAEK